MTNIINSFILNYWAAGNGYYHIKDQWCEPNAESELAHAMLTDTLIWHCVPPPLTKGRTSPLTLEDYQGNVRAVIDDAGVLQEVNNYYPYGALMGGGTVGNNQSVQPYKYGGKELDRQNGLDWYDSQARMYDPLLGRTPTMDALAEKYYSISPYAWCAGNPIKFIDPNGKWMSGIDEKKITYNEETDTWSNNTSEDSKLLLNIMKKTKTGKEQMYAMLNCSHRINLEIDRTSTQEDFGEGNLQFGFTSTTTKETDNGEEFDEVTIVVFMNIIRDLYAEDKDYKGKVQTLEEALGATVVHESVHGTDKTANSKLSDRKDTEEPAKKVEARFLDELEQIHKRNKE